MTSNQTTTYFWLGKEAEEAIQMSRRILKQEHFGVPFTVSATIHRGGPMLRLGDEYGEKP
jgi:hypothetical protein